MKYNPAPVNYDKTLISNYKDKWEYVPVDWLSNLPGNRLRRNAKEQEDLEQDIKQNGYKDPLIISVGKGSRTAMLGEGNHRLHAAKNLGYTHVPARVIVGTSWGSQHHNSHIFDKDLIPVPKEYFSTDARPSEVFKSLQGKTFTQASVVDNVVRKTPFKAKSINADPSEITNLKKRIANRKKFRRYVAFTLANKPNHIHVSAMVDGVESGRYDWEPRDRRLSTLHVPHELRGLKLSRFLISHAMEQFGLPMKIKALPFADAPISKNDLTNFYMRCGFRPISHSDEMIMDEQSVAMRLDFNLHRLNQIGDK